MIDRTAHSTAELLENVRNILPPEVHEQILQLNARIRARDVAAEINGDNATTPDDVIRGWVDELDRLNDRVQAECQGYELELDTQISDQQP